MLEITRKKKKTKQAKKRKEGKQAERKERGKKGRKVYVRYNILLKFQVLAQVLKHLGSLRLGPDKP